MVELKIIKPITEKDRRKRYGKKMAVFSFGFMGLFLGILILGIALSEGRTCLENQVLEAAVCMNC